MERIDRLPQDRLRVRLQMFIEKQRVQRGIIALILLNAASLSVETSATLMAHAGQALLAVDQLIPAVDARDHIEADLHHEVQAMRQQICELKTIVVHGKPARTGESGSN